MEQQHSNAGKDFYFVTESERKNLTSLLPRNVLLPVDPIKLTREQETNLCKLICNELNRFDPKELREVYIECSQHDKELRGFCGIEILDNSLRRHRAYLPETLRLVAAQFVDPNYPGKVNYEKTLSFIGSALHLNSNGQFALREIDPWSQEKQPKYYLQNGETFKTGSLFRDREVAKLLRLVEQELSKNTYAMDWTRWQNSFYERDRDHRDTLSAAQIKDICYDQKLPLSDSVINQILNLCEDNNRDGQYRWHSFLEFLQRVRPSNTGLPIPVSKRPLEYAKHYPEPGPNWPRTDADTERRGTSPRREISPRRGEQRRDDRYNDRDDYQQRDGRNSYRDDYQQREGRNSYRDGYRQNDGYRYGGGDRGGGRDEEPYRNREQQIMQLSQQLHDLESKYEVTKEAISSRDKPWLDRYLKMAQALYDSDISNKGSLPRKDVMAIVNQYNNAFNLKLDIDRANMLSISPENLDKSGNIILRSFLANLSADRISYKV